MVEFVVEKTDVIQLILQDRLHAAPANTTGRAFAPSNIALCKYWGKRNQKLNLPVTSSLSISLGDKGADAEITLCDDADITILNGETVPTSSSFQQRLSTYFDLFRTSSNLNFKTIVKTNIPIGAGLASSACGFASIAMALNDLFGWNLNQKNLSILARLGSGSASRSLWNGFVLWNAGITADGMDSFAEPLATDWPELCIGLLILDNKEKPVSSREAMQRTVETSAIYKTWPQQSAIDLEKITLAISEKNFKLLGETAEANAELMHATMRDSNPPVNYSLSETNSIKQAIWQLRKQGLEIFFTQDAGPNLKLLFLNKDTEIVTQQFRNIEIVRPFINNQ